MKKVWDRKRLGDCCEIVNGGTPKSAVSAYWGGPHRWITPAEMGGLKSPYLRDSRRTLTDAGLSNSSARLLPANSVILSSRAPIGHLVINSVPMATNQGCKGIVPSAGLEAAFLFYCLLGMVPQLDAMGSGTTFRELSSGKLKEVRIPVPSLSEQRRIVAILDEAFEGIAAAKVSAGRNLLNSKEVFKARVASLFRERDAEWIDTTLEAIAENLDSKRIPITKGQRQAGDYPYYGASGIIDFVNEYIFEGDCLLVSEDGANLLMRSSPIAFSVSGKYWVNNHAHILRFPDTATQRYVEFYLESIPIDRYVTGAAQPKLTQRAMNSIPVPMPKRLDRRKQIVDRIGHLESLTAAAKKICEAKLSALDELKASLLHQAFSGALVGHHESK